MKIFLLCFQLIICSGFLFSQYIITSSASGYQVNSLNGYGFENNNLTTVSNISNSNPSLITDLTPLTLGISKQFNSNIKNSNNTGMSYNQILNWFPQSAGFLLGLGNFQLGAGFCQAYNMELAWDPIPVTTVEQPDGTGEFVSVTSKTTILTSSLLVAYPIYNLFSERDQLSIGVQLNLLFIHHRESFYGMELESDFEDGSWNAGINYKFSVSIPVTKLSLFYEKGVKFSNSSVARDLAIRRFIGIDPIRNSNSNYAIIPFSFFSVNGYMPDKLTLGLLYQPAEKFTVAGNISGVFWNSYQENIHNQIELSSSLIYKWDNFITTSAGIYLTNRDYYEEYYTYYKNSAVFLSLGAVVNLPGFNIEAALADSHLFSDELRKQTLVKLGLNFLM